MKNLIKTILLLLLAASFLLSCQKLEIQEETFQEADTLKFDKKDKVFDASKPEMVVQSFDLKIHLFKGSTWRMWKKILKECMQAAWIPNAYYMGASNTISLGAIIDGDDGLERRLQDALTEAEIATVINYGNWTSCNYTQELTINLNTFIQADFSFTDQSTPDLNAELSLGIKKASSTKVKIDSWRVNNLVEGPLKDLIKNSAEASKKSYLTDLLVKENRIVDKEIEVKGFSSIIELSTEMSAGLEAKLKQGIIAKVGNAGFDAEFKFLSKTTIEVKSGGNFVPFIVKKKGVKV